MISRVELMEEYLGDCFEVSTKEMILSF
jgi:hypothetical protein